MIGQIGVDPGTNWGTGLVSTLDHTLRRKVTVCSGDPIGSDAFDPAPEWDGFAQDTFNGLGSHTANCGVTNNSPSMISYRLPSSGKASSISTVHSVRAAGMDTG